MSRAPRPSCLTASRAGRAAYFQPGERCGPTAAPGAGVYRPSFSYLIVELLPAGYRPWVARTCAADGVGEVAAPRSYPSAVSLLALFPNHSGPNTKKLKAMRDQKLYLGKIFWGLALEQLIRVDRLKENALGISSDQPMRILRKKEWLFGIR